MAGGLVLEGKWEDLRKKADEAARNVPGRAVRITIEALGTEQRQQATGMDFYRNASRSEWIEALDSIGRMVPDLPVLPDAAYDREAIYEGRT